MKRIFGVIFSYAVFAFALCLLVGSIMGHLPILIDGKKTSYTLCRALLFFFRILPAVLASGFLLGCSINFGKDSEKAVMRFSRVIMQHFKHVMIISIVLVAILTCTAEIFKPMVLRKKLQLEQAPHLLGEYIKNGKECLENKNYVLAHRYGTQALKILPTSVEGKALIDKSEAVLKAIKKVSQQETPVQEFTPHNEILGETVTSLIKKSREASLDKRWFDCHYYAQLAISAGSPMDSNLNEAKRLASVAWNNLQNAPVVERNKEQLLFLKKRAAYKSLSEGDNIDSYYQFLDIAAQDLTWSSDPDVTKFLAIAKSRVEDQCFFIDETERLETFENFMNVYFTIKHDSGVTDVVYIRGITPVLNGGRMIQYLRGFTMMTFEKNGRTFMGVSVEQMAQAMNEMEVDAMGFNCSVGPEDLIPFVRQLRQLSDRPIILKPNAGLPDTATGLYNVTPADFAGSMKKGIEEGTMIIGGCCGTDPEYISELCKLR